jgi:hypothetical protein
MIGQANQLIHQYVFKSLIIAAINEMISLFIQRADSTNAGIHLQLAFLMSPLANLFRILYLRMNSLDLQPPFL